MGWAEHRAPRDRGQIGSPLLNAGPTSLDAPDGDPGHVELVERHGREHAGAEGEVTHAGGDADCAEVAAVPPRSKAGRRCPPPAPGTRPR